MRQMYFKRAKIFLEQTDKGEQRFIASVGGPVQVPNWVCKTLGYRYGIKDGSIVDVTPPKHVAPIVDDDVEEEAPAMEPVDASEAAADEAASPDIPDEEEAEEPEDTTTDDAPEDAPAEPPTKPAKKPSKQPPSRAGKGTVR